VEAILARNCIDILLKYRNSKENLGESMMLSSNFWINHAVVAMLVGGAYGSTLLSTTPTQAQQAGSTTTQKKPKVELLLSAERQLIQKDRRGKEVKVWQALDPKNTTTKPGEILRFTLKAENKGDRPANQLTLVQPIPKGTVYILNTSIAEIPARIDYSIDGSKTFATQPTVKVAFPNGKMEARPAPAEAYTHVRWILERALGAKATNKVVYQVKVKS
jgi:uncharacterized repeat protein (TIGR01451 family)